MPKLLWLFVVMALLIPGLLFAQERRKSTRCGILLVAFGSSIPEARKAFDQVDAQTRQAFPGVEVRWAFTSKIIRAKLAKSGTTYDSPETALARMMDEGFTQVAVLSLHVFPGEEFHSLNRNALLFAQMADGFERLEVAPPLLNSHEDMERVCRKLLTRIPAERKPEDAVLFMGHGNPNHPANAVYAAMDFVLEGMAPNVFVACVEGYPTIQDILPKLAAARVKKVFLMPFMAVAGEHARKDMAGDGPQSWQSILTRQGYSCEVSLTGIGEYPEIVDIWLDHLREAFKRLQAGPTFDTRQPAS